jgi:hypothetical protein
MSSTGIGLPGIDFHTGGLGCPICQKELPLPQSPGVMERACDCGVVAILVSESTVHTKWGLGQSIRPQEGYRTILRYRKAAAGEGYVVFEQPMPARSDHQLRR